MFLTLIVEPLREEFKTQVERVKDEKRNKEYAVVAEQIKEKNFMDLRDFHDNARSVTIRISKR